MLHPSIGLPTVFVDKFILKREQGNPVMPFHPKAAAKWRKGKPPQSACSRTPPEKHKGQNQV